MMRGEGVGGVGTMQMTQVGRAASCTRYAGWGGGQGGQRE